MQNVVAPFELARALQRQHVERFFYDTNRSVSAGVQANRTGVRFGCIETNGTETHALLDIQDRFGKSDGFVARGAEEMVRETGGSFGSNTRQPGQFVDQPCDRLGGRWTVGEGHRLATSRGQKNSQARRYVDAILAQPL